MPHTDTRLALIHEWLARELGLDPERIEPASADASFRRYFRVFRRGETLIVMDAPPDKEDVRPYLHVTRLLEQIGVHVPHVHAADEARGLLLLEDLGRTHYLSRLRAGADPEPLYGDALRALADIQARGLEAARELGPYDREPLERELLLMPEWFCARHLQIELTTEERELLAQTFEFLIAEALAQPQVFVHRDYHSRNLMVLPERNPGVLDFQDALRGPIGYDLVSLLKDCYIAWPRGRVERWVRGYRELLAARGMAVGSDDREFLRWFDLIGVQRHIKVLGIFARLWHRDGKPGYLDDLPLTLDYVREACTRYHELTEFARFLERRIVPELPVANARVAAELSRTAGARHA
ncbi:MAG: phosphotransferase [Pseudomonadota bacterium]